MNKLIACGLALAAVSLAACEGAGPDRGPRAAAGLCYDFKKAAAPTAGDGAAAVEDCARRWAYSLAGGRDDAGMVAEAVAGACAAPLTRWNQASIAAPAAEGEATSILTGDPTTPIAEHNSFLRSRALLFVVQARAGRCAAPPIENGVPTGVG